MIESLLFTLAPMLLGAQMVLILVLEKGDICPGQRGRIHKLLPALGVLWLAVSLHHISAFIISAGIFTFFSKVQTGKTRAKGPLWILYLTTLLALLFVFTQGMFPLSTSVMFAWIGFTLLMGSSFAHLLLKLARSRLEAFHTILPIIGFLAGILLALVVAWRAMSFSEEALTAIQVEVIVALLTLIIGLLTWVWHMLFKRKPAKPQLVVSLVLLLSSSLLLQPMFM